jgi:hypothetical protein
MVFLVGMALLCGRKRTAKIEAGVCWFWGNEEKAMISNGDFFLSPQSRAGPIEAAVHRGAGAVEGKARAGDEVAFASPDPVTAVIRPIEVTQSTVRRDFLKK